MRKNQGFTMVELLVVLVIVAILAAVATPLFIQNTKRAKASEAVATMGLIRQAERDYKINSDTYFDIKSGSQNIKSSLPPKAKITLSDGTVSGDYGLDINVGTAQYFSNKAFTVEAQGTGAALADPTGSANIFTNPAPVDFIITATGDTATLNVKCSGSETDCAVKGDEVKDYILKMDNSGRIAISYNSGTTWNNY